MKSIYRNKQKKLNKWAQNNLGGLFLYNLIILVLVLLNTAGYFHPYYPITINIISIVALLSAVVLLRARSRFMFTICVVFFVFASILLVLGIRVWADRTMIYVFQSLFIGVVLLFLEETGIIKK